VRWTTWFWARLLLTADRLLDTHLVEWELARRQRKIDRLAADISAVNRELDALAEGLVLWRTVVCLVELKARSERGDVDDWLHFAPESDGEEALLDSAIECLVKVQLASIDAEPVGSGHYTYRLYPDWSAILTRLRTGTVGAELIAWLEKQSSS
jgi:hypothetical protein